MAAARVSHPFLYEVIVIFSHTPLIINLIFHLFFIVIQKDKVERVWRKGRSEDGETREIEERAGEEMKGWGGKAAAEGGATMAASEGGTQAVGGQGIGGGEGTE